MINRFRGRYNFLSNFYTCSIMYNGAKYKSAEHAYQAAKATTAGARRMVANAATAAIAKSLGRTVIKRADWEEVKVGIMRDILFAKFQQNPMLKERLLETGDEELIEGNTWNDTFWGVCRGVGENHLGKLLMEVRTQLKGE